MTTALPTKPSGSGPDRGPRRRRTRRRWVALVAVVGLLALPVASYVTALTYPGRASFLVRTVEWVRDHGGGPVVDQLESWWYARPPAAAAPDPAALPAVTSTAAPGPRAPVAIPALPGLPALRGEGQWIVGRADAEGTPVLFTTFHRPDPRNPGVFVGVARLDQRTTRIALVAGTTQPDRSTPPDRAQVPLGVRDRLVAAFNSGFKMADARGGALVDGRTVGTLRPGAASLVVHTDGTATVGQWGRDVGPAPDVVAVRQNLDLILEQGRPVAALADDTGNRWGKPKYQTQYTWRSAVGVDAAGDLVYVAGAGLNLATLADALAQAGAVRGMQLDIHNEMVDFLSYPVGAVGVPSGSPLLPNMPGGLDRYLVPDQRDFFVVTLR